MTAPNAPRTLCVPGAAAYFDKHEPILRQILTDLVAKVIPESGDTPAAIFASLTAGFGRQDHERVTTMAALAVMRLGELAAEHAEGMPEPVNEVDDSLSSPDGIVYAPCQPIGCDNGQHLPGCAYAEVDAFVASAHRQMIETLGEVVDHGPVKPPYGSPEREAYDRERGDVPPNAGSAD